MSSRGLEANAFNNTLEFNTRRKELSDVRVRRAIAHAIDVPFFIENFIYGQGKPATGPIPSISTGVLSRRQQAALHVRRQEVGRSARRGGLQAGRRAACVFP